MEESLAGDPPSLLVRRSRLGPPADAPCIASCGRRGRRGVGWGGAVPWRAGG